MGRKVIIVGAGVGGLACAGLLARQGFDVTVLEAHPFAGGKCTAFEKDGFHYDFGVHMFSRGDRGPHGQVNRRLGSDLSWITHDPACRVTGRTEFDFPLDITPFRTRVFLARRLGVKLKKLPGAYRLFRAILGAAPVEENDHTTLENFVYRYTDDPAVHVFVNCVAQLYFALSYSRCSAGEFIWCFSRMFREASFGYPAGGVQRIPDAFLAGLERSGGRLKLGEPVGEIIVRDGAVRGVNTDKGEYMSDVVVCNAGLPRTIKLAGERHFPDNFVESAKNLVYSNSYPSIKYALDRRVIPHPVVFHMPDLPADRIFSYVDDSTVPDDPYLFVPVPSNQDPSLAPPGKQLVIAATAAPPAAAKPLCNKILDKVHQKMCELFPELEDSMLWMERSTATDVKNLVSSKAGAAIGLGQVPGQTGSMRPGNATPVEGLYLVGADAGARGVGTEMAVGSAINLVAALVRNMAA